MHSSHRPSALLGSGQHFRLYHEPSSSSQAAHIAFVESGVDFELVKVRDLSSNTRLITRYLTLDPFNSPPLLEFCDGKTLREAPAILEFIADHVPHLRLAPRHQTAERAYLTEWLHFLARELHAREISLGPSSSAAQALQKSMTWIDLQLAAQPYVLGSSYSVGDIYLWALWGWLSPSTGRTSRFPNVRQWYLRIAARPAVRAALAAEA
jgi:glutathione S-transferase